MTDDLDTLLRDVGRDPTVDVDVDAVHRAGRRRAVRRRAAGALGGAVAVALLVVGVPLLLSGTTPDVDVAPQPSDSSTGTSPQPSDTPTGSETFRPEAVRLLTDGELAARTGRDVSRLEFWSGMDGVDVRVTTVDGDVGTESWDFDGRLTWDVGPRAVMTSDGAWWLTMDDGRLLRRAVDGSVTVVIDPGQPTDDEPDLPWLPVGVVDDEVIVRLDRVALEEPVDPVDPRDLFLLATDGRLTPFPGYDRSLVPLSGIEDVDGASLHAEQLVLVSGVEGEDRDRVVVVPLGGEGRVLADVRGHVAVLGGWILALEQGSVADVAPGGTTKQVTLRRWRVDGTELAGLEVSGLAGQPNDLRAVGDVLLVQGTDSPWIGVVPPSAVDGGGLPPEPVSAAALAVEGDVRHVLGLLPPEADEPDPTAACADAELQQPPGVSPSVWFACWDAIGRLDEGVATPFVRVDDRFAAGELPADASGIAAALDEWAAGPTPAEEAAGLSGGLDPVVASLGEVTIEGSTVVVDVLPGEQVGILSTSTGGAVFTQQVAGVVFQFDGYGDLVVDELVLTLDGSCEDWGEFVQAGECNTYDGSAAPWG